MKREYAFGPFLLIISTSIIDVFLSTPFGPALSGAAIPLMRDHAYSLLTKEFIAK